jgi:hypothetical protein
MRNVMRLSAVATIVLFACGSSRAQDQKKEQPSAIQSAGPETQFRIGVVVVTEFNGVKEISSLPYTLDATSSDPQAKIRTGMRIPVISGEKGGEESSFQYVDVGTRIDCTVGGPTADGKYRLHFIVGLSSVYVPGSGNAKKGWSLGDAPPSGDPMVQDFSGDFEVVLRDGQSEQGTSVTDPLTGHVIKVQVTLHVVK